MTETPGALAGTSQTCPAASRTNRSALAPWGMKSKSPLIRALLIMAVSLDPGAAMQVPAMMPGSHAACCAALPPAAMACAAIARLPSSGNAATVAPAASARMASSTMPSPAPPTLSGRAMPPRPSSCVKPCHSARSMPSPAMAARVRALVALALKKLRAVSAIIACSSVKAKFMRSPRPCAVGCGAASRSSTAAPTSAGFQRCARIDAGAKVASPVRG